MPKYSRQPVDPAKSVKARGSNLRVHFKNTRETAFALRGLGLKKAQQYLKDVIEHKDIIPFRRFTGCISRKSLVKKYKWTQGRFPEKSCRFLLDLLQNAESNAEVQGLDLEKLYVDHIQVTEAPRLRRRTYRAHGRINPYMSSPSHIELILATREDAVKKADDGAAAKKNKKTGKKLKQGATGFDQ